MMSARQDLIIDVGLALLSLPFIFNASFIMGDLPNHGSESAVAERAIASLVEYTTASAEEVRRLFQKELSRLETDAKIRTHLVALATSNVRGMLCRASIVASAPRSSS
jgi:hypothetical protein